MSQPTKDSDFSTLKQMEASPLNDSIMALGKVIVDESDMARSTDTLGRWMIHYIAGVMDELERVEGEEKNKLNENCCNAILEFWNHRNSVTRSFSPFADVEAICESLKALVSVPSIYFDAAQSNPEDEDVAGLVSIQRASKVLSVHLLGNIKKKISSDSLDRLEGAKELLEKAPEPYLVERIIRFADMDKRDLERDISILKELEVLIQALIQIKKGELDALKEA